MIPTDPGVPVENVVAAAWLVFLAICVAFIGAVGDLFEDKSKGKPK